MAISLRLTDEETTLIKKYADLKKMTVSDLIRQTMLERIEDEYDLTAFRKAIDDHESNPITYSHDDTKKMLELE